MTRPDRKPLVASLPLGAVYLTERFIKHDPPSADELDLLRSTIRKTLERQTAVMREGPSGILAGTAGTITTLAAMDQGLTVYDPDKINGYLMTKETIDGIVGKLAVSTLAERRSLPGLEQGREDIILAGAVVTQELMNWSGFSTMVVSDWGLREGLVLDLYERMNKSA
jgi:exopolyphosphatase/guanosine-5'-triphosphate,3'-diphosphate pyrophosphatase